MRSAIAVLFDCSLFNWDIIKQRYAYKIRTRKGTQKEDTINIPNLQNNYNFNLTRTSFEIMNWNNNTNMSNIFIKCEQEFLSIKLNRKHFFSPEILATACVKRVLLNLFAISSSDTKTFNNIWTEEFSLGKALGLVRQWKALSFPQWKISRDAFSLSFQIISFDSKDSRQKNFPFQ